MTREEAKQMLPIMQAYAEGKTVQTRTNTDGTALTENWIDDFCLDFGSNPGCFRIKPQFKYRPFKNAEECWQEMQKHQPFGWIQDKVNKNSKFYFLFVGDDGIMIVDYADDAIHRTYEAAYFDSAFADGTPFGIKEE